MKFLKLWDLSGYSERTMSKRPTHQKWAFWGQIVSEIVAQLCLKNSIKNPSQFFLGLPKKNLEGFAWSFLSITGLRSERQFAPKCPYLASRPLGHCSFRKIPTNPIISEISFLWRHRFSTLFINLHTTKHYSLNTVETKDTFLISFVFYEKLGLAKNKILNQSIR